MFPFPSFSHNVTETDTLVCLRCNFSSGSCNYSRFGVFTTKCGLEGCTKDSKWLRKMLNNISLSFRTDVALEWCFIKHSCRSFVTDNETLVNSSDSKLLTFHPSLLWERQRWSLSHYWNVRPVSERDWNLFYENYKILSAIKIGKMLNEWIL